MSKKKNDISNPDDDWFNKIYKELKLFVFDGKYPEIDNWFNDNVVGDTALESKLAQKIHDDLYFFSFQSNINAHQNVQEEILNRELAILKNFRIGLQLMLLARPIENVGFEHIKALKVTPDTKHLLQSNQLNSAITKLLAEKEYDELDKIQTLMDFNIFESKASTVTFCYYEDNSRGCIFGRLKENFFKPKYDLIFNFSEEKKDYLLSRNVIIPTEEESSILYEKMKEAMSSVLREKDISKIDLAFYSYKVQMNYYNLNKSVINTTTNNKKNKI